MINRQLSRYIIRISILYELNYLCLPMYAYSNLQPSPRRAREKRPKSTSYLAMTTICRQPHLPPISQSSAADPTTLSPHPRSAQRKTIEHAMHCNRLMQPLEFWPRKSTSRNGWKYSLFGPLFSTFPLSLSSAAPLTAPLTRTYARRYIMHTHLDVVLRV